MTSHPFQKLLRLVNRLHGPGGCPWDQAQTLKSTKPYLLEECYEVIDAINENDPEKLKEELGDLLFQILTAAKIAQKQKRFRITQMITFTTQKMTRRHPHVFGKTKIKNLNHLLQNWEKIKSRESSHRHRTSVLDGIPKSLPGLAKAQKVYKRSVKAKPQSRFQGTMRKLNQDAARLFQNSSSHTLEAQRKHLGALLFEISCFAEDHNMNAEDALQTAISGYQKKFRQSEHNPNA